MKDPARSSFPLLPTPLLLALVASLALSCATPTRRSVSTSTPEPETAAVAEPPEEPFDVETEAEALEARARDTFQLGVELHRSGHRLEAEESVSVATVRDEVRTATGRDVDAREVALAFEALAATGRFALVGDAPDRILRHATRQERAPRE